MDWFYIVDDKQCGPVAVDQLWSLVKQRVIQEDTPVWQEGMEYWKPYLEIATTLPRRLMPGEAPPRAPATCSQCAQQHLSMDMVPFGDTWMCGACKPVFIQRLMEGASRDGQAVYGGFWNRLAAACMDGLAAGLACWLIVFVPASILEVPRSSVLPGYFLMVLAFLAGYEIVLTGAYGATPGKMLCRLKVVAGGGEKVSLPRSTARHFAKYLGVMTGLMGFIMAGFDREKRSLHDYVCNTRVIGT